jgi:hypothetical protein
MVGATAEYEGNKANRGGGLMWNLKNFDSVVPWREDLSPQNSKCPPSHSRNVANLCTNTSCNRGMQKNAIPFVLYHFNNVWYSMITKAKELI